MTDYLNLLSALIAPWCLGYVIVRGLLKTRYGYQWLALGAGYLIGLYSLALTVWLTKRFLPFIELNALLLGYVLLAIGVFLAIRPTPCFVDEQRLELPLPVWQKRVMLLLLVVLLIVFMTMSAIDMPKQEKIAPVMMRINTWYALDEKMLVLWRLGYPVMGFMLYGGLRYTQCESFTAFVTVFVILMLPMLLQSALMDVASFWCSMWVWMLFASFANWLVYREWRQYVLFLLSLIGLMLTNMTIGLVLLLTLGLVALCKLDNWRRLLIISLLVVAGYLLNNYGMLPSGIHTVITETRTTLTQLAWLIYFHKLLVLFTEPDWGLLFYTLGISVLFWLMYPKPKQSYVYRFAQLYILIGVVCFVVLFISFQLMQTKTGQLETECILLLVRYIAPMLGCIPPLTFEACRFKPNLSV